MSRARDDETADLADLIGVFDHELRTPLAALRGHLELLRERTADLPPDVVASLEVMGRAVDRLEATVTGVSGLEATVVELRSVG